MRAWRIRREEPSDFGAVKNVHESAFNAPGEAELVRLIRVTDAFVAELSIVAERGGQVIGHILFSKISLIDEGRDLNALSLAPVGVLPEFQRRGIGAELIQHGIGRAAELGFSSILVLGDPRYYGKFGFKPELARKIESCYACDAFAGLELKSGALSGVTKASATYPKAFSALD